MESCRRHRGRAKRTYICDFSRGGLNTRLYTLVSKPCSEATNIGYFILWELSLEVEEQSEFMFWWNLREISDSYGLNKFVNTLLLIEKSRGHNYTIMALGQVSIL